MIVLSFGRTPYTHTNTPKTNNQQNTSEMTPHLPPPPQAMAKKNSTASAAHKPIQKKRLPKEAPKIEQDTQTPSVKPSVTPDSKV